MPTAAERYFMAGFKIVDLHPSTKMACGHDKNGIAIEARPTMWQCDATLNLGLKTGEDFWVLDVDGDVGQKALTWLEWAIGSRGLERAHHVVQTGKGIHIYFAKEPELYIPTCTRLMPGIDVLGQDGMVVAPPSIHENGKSYRFVEPTDYRYAGALPAPEKLVQLVQLGESRRIAPNAKNSGPSFSTAVDKIDSVKASPVKEYDAIRTGYSRYAKED